MLDFYSVLGLSRHANHEEIKAAYWNLAKQSHPDVNAGDRNAEQRTKAINSAYETLGDPDARAAYDLELQRQRTWARRSFWASAATGVATCVLTVGFFSVMVMWKQHGDIHPSPSSEVALSTGSPKNEHLVAKPPADERASVPATALANAEARHTPSKDVVDAPSESVNTADLVAKPPANERASVPPAELASAEGSHVLHESVSTPPSEPSEPSKSANVEVASVVLRDARAVAPSAVLDGPADEELPSELSGTVQAPEGQRPAPTSAGETSPVTEHGNQALPEVAKLPTSAAAADQRSNATVAAHEEPKAPAFQRTHERTKKYFYKTAIARPTIQGKPQGSEQTPRLVAKSAMALRFPSADEPYINLGVRER